MSKIKKYHELKNTTDYKVSLYYARKEERERILSLIDGHKEVYQKGETRWDKTVVSVEAGEEKDHLDSCCNEVIDEIIEAISTPNSVPESAIL